MPVRIVWSLRVDCRCCSDGAAASAPALGKALRNVVTNPSAKNCKSDDPDRVVVCGRSRHPYRIDPDVLAAERAVEAPPVRAPLTADDAHMACIGAQCGTGGVVPLVGMALTALKAAELAADGDDWRDAFRTHPDEYRAYEQARSKPSTGAGVSVGVSAGSH